tara:strand:+ start:106 stop:564 length:459 start_codon:yes stop_codon:yes gene_type:complete
MKYVITLLFLINNVLLANYAYEDNAILKKHGKIITTDNGEYAIISILGHWTDNTGSFGKTECYGKLETNKGKVILFETFCKRESKKGFFLMRGLRDKADLKSGIGFTTIIDATGIYKKLIGEKCTYAAAYYKDSVHIVTKCNINKNILSKNN